MTRVLITGITGLIGSHLASHFCAMDGIEVFGFKRWRSPTANIKRLEGLVTFLEGDIEDPLSVRRVVERASPDRIYHLAAQSYPKESLDAPYATLRTNVEGTLNLLEAVCSVNSDCLVQVASSSAVYGQVDPLDSPVSENHPLRPASTYGVSKVAQELLALQYAQNYGLRVYICRLFNQAGPGQDERSALQTFCRQLARIEIGKQEPVIKVGNLETRRDYTDVRDTVEALHLHVERGRSAMVYNIGSGRAVRIGDLLQLVLDRTRLKVDVAVEPGRLRPSDEPLLEADTSLFRRDTGWQCKHSIGETVDSVLAHWRRVEAGGVPM